MLATYAAPAPRQSHGPASATLASQSVSSSRAIGGLAILIVIQEVALGPDEELLGVVVHSGLVLGRSKDVVVAVRRITAFPSGLALDTVVLARDLHAEAACSRRPAASAWISRAKTTVSRASPPGNAVIRRTATTTSLLRPSTRPLWTTTPRSSSSGPMATS
jgi:hypothetical protein